MLQRYARSHGRGRDALGCNAVCDELRDKVLTQDRAPTGGARRKSQPRARQGCGHAIDAGERGDRVGVERRRRAQSKDRVDAKWASVEALTDDLDVLGDKHAVEYDASNTLAQADKEHEARDADADPERARDIGDPRAAQALRDKAEERARLQDCLTASSTTRPSSRRTMRRADEATRASWVTVTSVTPSAFRASRSAPLI